MSSIMNWGICTGNICLHLLMYCLRPKNKIVVFRYTDVSFYIIENGRFILHYRTVLRYFMSL